MSMMDSKDWIKKGREKAPELRDSAKAAVAEMFATGDLSGFLNVLSRLPSYDACNLVLILLQYPKATCLAGYRVWERLMADPRASILKPEWRGKAIDLIAPFTEQRDKRDLRLTWFAVSQFDIAQTNVSYSLPPSVYVVDDDHMRMLIEGACRALRREYHLTVHHATTEAGMSNAALPGFLTDKIVYLYDDAKPPAQLAWLVVSARCRAVRLHCRQPVMIYSSYASGTPSGVPGDWICPHLLLRTVRGSGTCRTTYRWTF